MTRINIGILPQQLCDQHLLAEHREIVRVRLIQHSKQTPNPKFNLGKGHVIFFKDKLGYIFQRYLNLLEECRARRFNVTDMSLSFADFDCDGHFLPNSDDIQYVKVRISERLKSMKYVRYRGKNITCEEAIELLTNYVIE